jgi:uncharacterized membrane protein
MQNPPPGPPPGGQPNYPPPAAASGIDKKTGATLSYLLGWVTGVIFLFVGKDDPDVKYHAAQSVVFFGALTVIFWVMRFVDAFLPTAVVFLFSLVLFVIGVFSFVVWIMCLYRAYTGGGARFEIPIVGGIVTPYAEQLANAV